VSLFSNNVVFLSLNLASQPPDFLKARNAPALVGFYSLGTGWRKAEKLKKLRRRCASGEVPEALQELARIAQHAD